MPRGAAIVLTLCLLFAGGTVLGAPGGGRHVQASLVAESDGVTPGQPLLVGLRLQMEPGWHTYWRNPGDSGLATKVRWDLPEGFSAGPVQWPRPIRFRTGPHVSYGYEGEVLLPVEVQVPSGLSSPEVRLVARVSWLECQDVCLPGKAELTLSLPVKANPSPGPAAPLFAEARRRLPTTDPGWTFSASAGSGGIELTVAPPAGTTLDEAYFYPVTRRVLDHSKPQPFGVSGSSYRIELPIGAGDEVPGRLEGVLVGETARGPVALVVDVKPR
jgi:thiol:disulfide interchange protein DsbD